ncbi:MAG: penicillin-binding protein 2 [Halobacteriovoraceae bacterium]|jgi:penicillin-binding protein 2|nr:penicillin-binding protein 2 [Halobacteriovoraceae bacterium]
MFGEDDIVKHHKKRADIIFNIVLFCFSILFARLWYLQIYKGEQLLLYSQENRLRKEPLKAPRGMVYSRNNELLVHNIPRFDATVTPQFLKNKKQTLAKLSEILNMTENKINKILKKNRGQARYRSIIIKKNISRGEVAIIETENFKMPGVGVQKFISREYRDKKVGGHLFGYISEVSQEQLPKFRKRDNFNYRLGDFIGQAGLEEKLDLNLRGLDGYEYVEVDAQGRKKRYIRDDDLFKGLENKRPKPGRNIRLTIDRDLQLKAYEALKDKVGAAVAVDVNTGEILAMISRPSYDPTQFSRGLTQRYWSSLINNDKKPLRNRSIQDHYAPGSTFKTITAIAALEEGIVDENTTVKCTGKFRLGRRKFHCWKQYGHGKVNLKKAIRESCDVYFYKVATQMDIDILAKYARMFGFGVRTGITLPNETMGLVPTREWKQKRYGQDWVQGETLSCVIGQSFVLTTPLQLAMSYSAIANEGKLYQPYLIKEIFNNSGEVEVKYSPKLISEIKISPETYKQIKSGLFEVVNKRKGTAWWHRGSGIQMAGKTGTSQVVNSSPDKLYNKCEEKEYRFRHHGVFAAYAPADDPKIAVGVVVEHGCHGSSAAAPVAKAIINEYMRKYYPELKKNYAIKERVAYSKMINKQKRAAAEKERLAAELEAAKKEEDE